MVQTFFVDEAIKEMYTLDSVITVVDAKEILDRLAEEKPEGVENESVEQVCFADKILLNKTDLSDEAKLTKIEAGLSLWQMFFYYCIYGRFVISPQAY